MKNYISIVYKLFNYVLFLLERGENKEGNKEHSAHLSLPTKSSVQRAHVLTIVGSGVG